MKKTFAVPIVILCSIFHLHSSDCANFKQNRETYLFVKDIDNFRYEYQRDNISCSLYIEKSRSYVYRVVVRNAQGITSSMYGEFNLVDRNDGSHFFVNNAVLRSDSGKKMRHAQVLLIKRNGKFYYLIAVSIQENETLYTLNVISPVAGVINPLNATTNFSDKVEFFMKKSTENKNLEKISSGAVVP